MAIIRNFIERNKNTYTKVYDAPQEVISKYSGVLPYELINIWKIFGLGIFEDGFLQLVNPDEYQEILDDTYNNKNGGVGFDVVHNPSSHGRLGDNHARLTHSDGVDGFSDDSKW